MKLLYSIIYYISVCCTLLLLQSPVQSSNTSPPLLRRDIHEAAVLSPKHTQIDFKFLLNYYIVS